MEMGIKRYGGTQKYQGLETNLQEIVVPFKRAAVHYPTRKHGRRQRCVWMFTLGSINREIDGNVGMSCSRHFQGRWSSCHRLECSKILALKAAVPAAGGPESQEVGEKLPGVGYKSDSCHT